MSDPNLPETEHLKIHEAAYQRLVTEAADEVIRCLLASESPLDLTLEKVRNQAQIFAACSTEPWARTADVIRPREGGRDVPSDVLRKEYYRLLRALRDQLLSALLNRDREVWGKARQRMVKEAEHAVFRVTESAVHLHRLTSTKDYARYG